MQPRDTPDAELLAGLEAADEQAAAELFAQYYQRLYGLVSKQRGWKLKQVESSSDVVQSVFQTVFRRGQGGELTLGEHETLWPLLATIAMRKIHTRAAYWGRQRRDVARLAESPITGIQADGPTADDALVTNEILEQLVDAFPERRRSVALMLIEGRDISDISREIGVSQRTVYHTRKAMEDLLTEAIREVE